MRVSIITTCLMRYTLCKYIQRRYKYILYIFEYFNNIYKSRDMRETTIRLCLNITNLIDNDLLTLTYVPPQSQSRPDTDIIAPHSNIATNIVYIERLSFSRTMKSASSIRRRVKILQSQRDQRYSCEYIALHNRV